MLEKPKWNRLPAARADLLMAGSSIGHLMGAPGVGNLGSQTGGGKKREYS